MSMDKTHCFDEDRTSEENQSFVANFIKYAFVNASKENLSYVYCPCKKCQNTAIHEDAIGLKDGLFMNDFDPTYKFWFWHGENVKHSRIEVDVENDDRMDELVDEIVKNYNGNPKRLSALHGHNETLLYDRCPKGITVLKAMLHLMNVKEKYSYSDVGFTGLLKFLKEMLLVDNRLLEMVYETKKVLCSISMNYKKIHACQNDCILYWGDQLDTEEYLKCNAPSFKLKEVDDDGESENQVTNKVSIKVVWCLPIIPQLRELFDNPEDAR